MSFGIIIAASKLDLIKIFTGTNISTVDKV